MKNKLATIMCVHSGDSAEHLKESIDSVLEQSYQEHDVHLLVNGDISSYMRGIIENYQANVNFYVVFSSENMGLAKAMNYLLDNFVLGQGYLYVARMDADDICLVDRFKKQIDFLEANPGISVVGSDCIEIDGSGVRLGYKKMAASDSILKRDIIKRCPFNHPSVMIRVGVFESGCRYNPLLKNTQDYYLWVDLISKGYIFANINEGLIKFRVTASFYQKRGKKKAFNDLNGRIYAMKKLRLVSAKNIVFAISLFLLRLSPAFISRLAYKFLR